MSEQCQCLGCTTQRQVDAGKQRRKADDLERLNRFAALFGAEFARKPPKLRLIQGGHSDKDGET